MEEKSMARTRGFQGFSEARSRYRESGPAPSSARGCGGSVLLASPGSSPRTLAEYCPALRSLRVRHCHHVAEPSLSRLRKRGVDIDVEPPLHQALVLLQDVVGFAPFVNLQV
ncbi:uncharacterized protein ACIGJ3_020513 [Trichechus inunguis]